jgi:hypothetical protein
MDNKILEKGEESASPTKSPLEPPGIKSLAKNTLLLQQKDTELVAVVDGEKGAGEYEKKGGRNGKFKRLDKSRPVKGEGRKGEVLEKKRKMDLDEELKESGVKKVKGTEVSETHQNTIVGPADRSCGTQ